MKDAENKVLTRQVANLKTVIMEQGLTMPPPEPVHVAHTAPAPTLTPAVAPAPAPFNPNGQEEFPKPTGESGWQYTGANRAANRPTWGNTTPPPSGTRQRWLG